MEPLNEPPEHIATTSEIEQVELEQVETLPMDTVSLANRSIALTNLDLECYASQFQAQQRLRSSLETVDLLLSTEDGTVEPVHSYYLALKAPKFWAHLIAPQVERLLGIEHQHAEAFHEIHTTENIVLQVPRILVPGISGRMLKIAVSCMYEGAVQLDYDLSWQLLGLAHQFELDMLADTCLKYLASTLSAKNCIQLMQVALQFGHNLASIAYRFILQHFDEIMPSSKCCNKCNVIGQLSLHQLKTILADDNLNIGNEIQAWRALLAWICQSPADRIAHFWSLFLLVRWQLMHSQMIKNEVVHDFCNLVCSSGNVLFDKKAISSFKWPISVFNSRVPHEVVFLYGGYEHGLPSSTLKTFDIRSRKVFSIDLPGGSPRVHHAMVAFKQKLFIFGGSDGLKVLDSVTVFDPATGRFRDRKPMSEPRVYLSVVKYREFIIIMGGNNGKERLRSCEMYDTRKKLWCNMASMNSARSDASAAVLNDKIYIAGGVETFGISSVEMYSFETRYWTVVSFMNLPRRGHALLAHKNALFAIGGCTDINEYTCLRSVERMSPTTNQWQFVAPLTVARSSFSACVLEDKLFVFGGYDGFSSRKSIECYNHLRPDAKWEKVSSLLETELSAASVAIVAGLPNAMHYTYYGQCLLQPDTYLPTSVDRNRKPQRIARYLVSNSLKMLKKIKK